MGFLLEPIDLLPFFFSFYLYPRTQRTVVYSRIDDIKKVYAVNRNRVMCIGTPNLGTLRVPMRQEACIL